MKITAREIVRLFCLLEAASVAYAATPSATWRKVELHDAAMVYAAAVYKVARADRKA